jgi:hypothetical protein
MVEQPVRPRPPPRVRTGALSPTELRAVRQIVKAERVRTRLRPARLFSHRRGYYDDPRSRRGLKASFRSARLERTLSGALRTMGLRLRPGHHVDMLRYTRGGFIHRHVDMVAGGTLAHATHMSVLVGLQTLPEGAGGHTLVWADDDDRDASPTRYAEAGRAGGVLAFDSRMPHAGEVLRCGEKEVLVLSAWCDNKDWSPPPPPPRLRGDGLLDVRCLAVYATRTYTEEEEEDAGWAGEAGEAEEEVRGVALGQSVNRVYVYINGRPAFVTQLHAEQRASPSDRRPPRWAPRWGACTRVTGASTTAPVDFDAERERLLRGHAYERARGECAAGRALRCELGARRVEARLHEAEVARRIRQVHWHREVEMCNGGEDDYGDYGGEVTRVWWYRLLKEVAFVACSDRGYARLVAEVCGGGGARRPLPAACARRVRSFVVATTTQVTTCPTS